MKATSKAGRPIDLNIDETLLQVAEDLIFNQGPHCLTMTRVATTAGISKVTLYSRFANRHELLQAVLNKQANNIYQSLLENPNDRKEFVAQLETFADAGTAFVCAERHQRLIQAISTMPQEDDDLTTVYINGPGQIHEVLERFLKSASQHEWINCPNPRESAELLMGMMMGLDLVRASYRMTLDRKDPELRKKHLKRVMKAFLAIHVI